MTRREFLQSASASVLLAGCADGGSRGPSTAQAAPPLPTPAPTPPGTTRIGIAGDRFTVDRTPTFLLGVSYFDARNWKQPDIDGLADRGFNNIRIWMENGSARYWKSWHLDPSGTLNDPDGLLELIRACAAKGITVEVTILDWESTPLSRNPELAIGNVVNLLKHEPNVFYDVCNEHTHGARAYASHALMRTYRDRIKSIQPTQVVTASGCCGHLMNSSGQAIGADLRDDTDTALLDFVAPHMPRTADWSAATDARVGSVKRYLASIGRSVPVFLQEEPRRGHSGLNPTAGDFFRAAVRARAAGAAGWIFHTPAAFDLAGAKTFFGNLDPEERRTVNGLAARVSRITSP